MAPVGVKAPVCTCALLNPSGGMWYSLGKEAYFHICIYTYVYLLAKPMERSWLN